MIRNIAIPPWVKMLVSFAGTSVINYVFSLAAAWLLVPGDFGLLAFIQTILLIAGLILNSGFVWSLTAELVGTAGPRRAALVRGGAVANLALAGVMSAAVLALFGLGPLRTGLETWTIAGLTAAALPCIALAAIARATAQGYERFGWVALIQITEVASKAAAGVLLIKAGFGVSGAVAGFVVGGAVALVPSLLLLLGVLRLGLWGPAERPQLQVVGGMFGALLGMALLLNLDIVALKSLSGADRTLTGHYQAAIILANMPYYLASAMLPPLFTQAARLQQIGRTGPAVGEALRLVLLLALPLELVLLIAPEQALALLFSASYTPGPAVVRAVATANCALMLVAMLSSTFQATGQARIPARILLTVTACEALVLGLVIPSYHALGAALTFLTATLAALLALGTMYLRALDQRLPRAALLWLGKYAVLLALCAGLGALVLQTWHSLILAGVVAGPCYLAGVAGLRLVRLPRFAAGPLRLRTVGGEK